MNFNVSYCNSCNGKMMKVPLLISQGSVATQLRCGKKHDKCFITNFLLNPQVKEF